MALAEILGIILAALAAIVIGAFAVVYLFVPIFKALGWLIRHVFRFVWGELSDAVRLVGALLLSVLYVPLILGNFVIARFSAASHFGRALMSELGNGGVCVYRMVIGHPARLLLLAGLTEGIERRLPAVLAAAPTADLPRASGSKRGLFDGYEIVGSLAGGGSGAKLYVANPDPVKAAAFNRAGLKVEQVVIKSFSLADGSSLPQIVRESRSLDAAKRLGLILDHELAPDRFYYVMRYVPGESLSLITKQLHATSSPGGLDAPQLGAAVQYAIDLVTTLSTYHRGGLWHKDVKPDNIIVATKSDRRAHLVDFGLVSSLRSAMTLTTHGTEYFRDPEMVRQALKGVKVHEVDGTRFDIFAAGAVLYSMIEDSFPAHGVLSQVTKRCPEAVKWVIRRAMTDYDKRYASADAMLADLTRIAQAPDPYSVRPVDLPSMSGMGMASEPPPVNASVPPPLPNQAGGAPVGVASPAPRIRVKNWWSGEAAIDGAAPAGGSTPSWIAAAERAARGAQQSVGAAMAGLGIGAGAVGGVGSPAQAGSAGTPRVGAEHRRTAAEQLRSARERARSSRDRARKRLAGLRSPAPHFKPGMGGGVAVALMCLLGGAVVVGSSLSKRVQRHLEAPDIRVSVSNDLEEGESELGAEQSVATDTMTASETSVRERESAANRTEWHSKRAHATKASASVRPKASVPAPAPALSGRVLLLNDLKTPMSAANTARLEVLTRSMSATGLTVFGDAGPQGYEPAASDLDALASLRKESGLAPLDSAEIVKLVASWLQSHAEQADAVVWVAPAADKAAEAPVIRLFAGNNSERSTGVRSAFQRAMDALTPR